jgi:hypothetical protein
MLRDKRYGSKGFRALPVALMLVFGANYSTEALPPPNKISFQLFPNPQLNVIPCLRASAGVVPSVLVTVERQKFNDQMTLTLKNFKPGLAFDLFTVENSPLRSNGTRDPLFKNFGLAWYQSDIETGTAATTVTIKTVLLDEIFGFDPKVNLPPTNTFHVGFWFDKPKDAAACGFAGPPTPFNPIHKAGPNAFISKPRGVAGLGPLCTNPDNSTTPPTCKL